MDTNPSALKSSVFGGFKKKDVLSYIFELNESTQEAQQKFAEQIEELDRSRTELSRNVAELEARLAEVQADLDNATSNLDNETARNIELREQLERVKTQAAKLTADISGKESEIIRITALSAELQEKNRVMEEKRSQVELAASQIAGLLSEARSDADKMLEDARREAGDITAGAKKQADGIIAEAKTSASNYVENANKSVNDIYKKFGKFREKLDGLSKDVAASVADITAKVGSLNEAAETVSGSVPEVLTPEKPVALKYESVVEEASGQAAPAKPEDSGPSEFAREVLGRYGVRKDDSGFFRLAAEKNK